MIGQTPFERYLQANSWLYTSVPVFQLMRGLYLFSLIFFALVLGISLILEFKKIHPHIVARTAGLLVLLVVFLKF